ncbi:hypothetical protein [Microbispora sp. NPDC049125]|uniref:hypothetical protein n=1 Tax=Microbispora sp. NPDC049125 TaxID=3154929 RepID=UPI00346656E8
MPTYRNVIAGLAISTALAGGVVGLSTVTSATAASATTIHTSISSCDPGGWGHRRACRTRWGGHHNRFRSEQRFRQTVKKFATAVRNCNSDGDVIIDIDSDD